MPVDQGLVEGGMQFAHFFSGKHPASYLFADQPTIGGMDQFTYLSWFAEGGGNDLYQQLLDEELKANIIAFVMLMSGGQPLRLVRGSRSTAWRTSKAQVSLAARSDR